MARQEIFNEVEQEEIIHVAEGVGSGKLVFIKKLLKPVYGLLLIGALGLLVLAVGPTSKTSLAAPLAQPEQLSTVEPFDVALGGGYVFWTRLSGEFCVPEGAVGAVNLTTRVETTLESDCNLDPANVAADETHVYYVEWDSDTIERIPATGGSPIAVAAASGLIFHRGLLVDETHVYFVDDEGIKRAPKDGGATDTLAAGHDGEDLAQDDTHIYWTEGDFSHSSAIRRVAKSGGSVETIVSGSGLDDVGTLTVDETTIYFDDAGSVKRVSKAGGTISTLAPAEPNYQLNSLTVNDTDLFWADTTGSSDGRIRRVAKTGGAVENLALGLFGPTGVSLSSSHVYWGDSDGIWRLPLDAGSVAVDLTVSGLEITQGIQNLANDVPLVADKTTYVRVYPAVDTANTPNVQAVLHGTRGGVGLPGSPLSPVSPSVYVRQSGGNRDFLSNSFYFWLPPSWRSGTVTFSAEINPGGTIPESDADNNLLNVTETFETKDPLCVDMVRVRTNPTTASVYDPGFWDIVDWLKAAHPAPDVSIYRGGTIEELEVCFGFGFIPHPCGGPYEMPDDSSWVLAKLWTYNLFTNDPGECNNQAYYYGMVHPSHVSQGGAGFRPGEEAWGVMNIDPTYLGGRWPWYVPHGGSTLAHELGHNLGRLHVDCGGPANTDSGYPYNNCDIAPDAPDSYYGFDVLDVAVIPPTEAGDLMSYAVNVGKPRWPSDYTYRALESSLAGALADPAPQATNLTQKVLEAAETLAVTGVISPTEGTASFNYAYRLSEGMVSTDKLSRLTARIQTNGNYSLRLLDENEQILVEQTFTLPDEGDPFGDTRAFNMLLPYDPASAFLVLTSDSTELARRPISPAAPTVQVITPNGGENIAGAMTVEWQAADADDDDLLYTVQYSADGGTRWQTVVTDYYTPTLTLDDLSTLPGSDTALIRIIATDGVNTTADASDATFQVAPNPPEAHISSPADGAAFVQSTQVVLIGVASDPEDGSLSGEDLTWSVDGAPAGSGREATLTDLTPGSYEVTLTATDSSDAQGSDTITLLVVEDASQGASIQIRKQATDSSTVFNFTLDGQPFSLKNGQLFLVGELDSGPHTVVETVPAGWELLSIRCDNGQTLSKPDSPEVTIDLETDEDVVCTFTNSGPTSAIYLPVIIK